MFKVGDRVVRTKYGVDGVKLGEVYVVESCHGVEVCLRGVAGKYATNKFELVEYEWPCRICDATEFFDGEQWKPYAPVQASMFEKLSYNHRREIKPTRPVTAEDIGKEVMWDSGDGVLVAHGPEFCLIKCPYNHVVPTQNLTTHG